VKNHYSVRECVKIELTFKREDETQARLVYSLAAEQYGPWPVF
jgi:hypothetical protein